VVVAGKTGDWCGRGVVWWGGGGGLGCSWSHTRGFLPEQPSLLGQTVVALQTVASLPSNA